VASARLSSSLPSGVRASRARQSGPLSFTGAPVGRDDSWSQVMIQSGKGMRGRRRAGGGGRTGEKEREREGREG
jgi:hypothetical protein